MERTPKSKRLSLSHKIKGHCTPEKPTNNDNIKTPTQNIISLSHENDYSPVYIQQTQEALDQLDVVWDWNSPQSVKNKKKLPAQKRPCSHQSPILIKKHSSNNQIECYDKLKHELEALKNELVESKGTETHSKVLFNSKVDEEYKLQDLNDFFEDDSLEEEMILQSQKIEQLLTMQIQTNICDTPSIYNSKSSNIKTPSKSTLRKVKSENHMSSSSINRGIIKTNSNLRVNINQEFSLDSRKSRKSSDINLSDLSGFADFGWESFIDKVLIKEPKKHEQVTKGIENVCNQMNDEQESNKICSSEEIEKKRLQALAKLKSKKQQVTPPKNTNCYETDIEETNPFKEQIYRDEASPIKCSPEEIEQKRLQALAKLHAKKKQDQIERNRREALKRLEFNKKKRTLQYLSNKK